jgi:hypothetical protein
VVLVVLALLIVLAGSLIDLPWLGVLLALVTIPALAVVLRQSASDQPLEGNVGKMTGVLATAGAVLGVIVAAFIAFAAVCLPAGFLGFGLAFEQRDQGLATLGEVIFFAGWPLGIAAGIAVGWFLSRRLWPRPGSIR